MTGLPDGDSCQAIPCHLSAPCRANWFDSDACSPDRILIECQQMAATPIDRRQQAILFLALDHSVTFPVPNEAPVIDLSGAMLDALAVGNLAKSCALCLGTVFAASLGLAEVLPEIATGGLVIPDQGVDPLVTDAYSRQGRHETADLLWAPFLSQPVDDSGDHAGQVLRPHPGGEWPMITARLRLLWTDAARERTATQLTADRSVVDTKLSGDMTPAHAQVMTGMRLVSTGPG